MIGEGGDQIKSVSSFAAGVTDFPLDSDNDAHERLLNFLIREDDAAFIRNGSTTLDTDTRTNASSSFTSVVSSNGAVKGLFPFRVSGVEKVFVHSKDDLFYNSTGSTWAKVSAFTISANPESFRVLNEDLSTGTFTDSVQSVSVDFLGKTIINAFDDSTGSFSIPTILIDDKEGLKYLRAGLPTPKSEYSTFTKAQLVTVFNALLQSFQKHSTNQISAIDHVGVSPQSSISPFTGTETLAEMIRSVRLLHSDITAHMVDARYDPNIATYHKIVTTEKTGFLSFLPRPFSALSITELAEAINDMVVVVECHYKDFFYGANMSFRHAPASVASQEYITRLGDQMEDVFFKTSLGIHSAYPYFNYFSLLVGLTAGSGPAFMNSVLNTLVFTFYSHAVNLTAHSTSQFTTPTHSIANYFNVAFPISATNDADILVNVIGLSVSFDAHVKDSTTFHPGGTELSSFNTAFKAPYDTTNTSPILYAPNTFNTDEFRLLWEEVQKISYVNDSGGTFNPLLKTHWTTPRHSVGFSSTTIYSVKEATISALSAAYGYERNVSSTEYVRSAPYIVNYPPYLQEVVFLPHTAASSTAFVLRNDSAVYFTLPLPIETTGIYNGETVAKKEGIFDGTNYYVARLASDGVYYITGKTDSKQTILVEFGSGQNLTDLEPLYTTGGVPEELEIPPSKVSFKANSAIFLGNTREYERSVSSDGYSYVSYKNRVRQTLQGLSTASPGTFFVDLPEEVICGAAAKDKPVFVTTRGVYRIDGIIPDDGNGALSYEQIYDRVGGVSYQGAISCNNVVYFAGTDGFYMTDGYQVQPISENLKISYSLIDKDKIKAAYNRAENSIYWAISHSGVYDEIWVLNLEKPITEKSCFTKLGGSPNFRPTAIAFTDESELLRGDEDGWVFIHGSSYLADPRVNRNTGALERNSSSELLTAHIPFDLASAFFSFGSTRLRKYVTDWDITVENINPRTDDRQSFSIQPYYNNDKGRIAEGLSSYVTMKPIAYIDPPPGLVEIKRKFSAGSLRCLYKQLGFRNASVLIADFDEINNPQPPGNITGKVTITAVSPTVWTATLNSGYNFPVSDLQGCELYLEYDGYMTAFTITDANDGADADTKPDTLVITHPSATPPTGGANMQKWRIKGYPKTERFAVIGYNIPFHIMSSTKDVQVSGRS